MRIASHSLRFAAVWGKYHALKLSQQSKIIGHFASFSSQAVASDKVVIEGQKPTFASMLRNSSFIQMGQHENVPMVGKIVQVQDTNLYIDFGGKFYCVCDLDKYVRNLAKRQHYRRGKYVVIELLDFELSARFLGATQDTTLLEADAILLGLYDDYMKGKALSDKQRKSLQKFETSLEADIDEQVLDYLPATDESSSSDADNDKHLLDILSTTVSRKDRVIEDEYDEKLRNLLSDFKLKPKNDDAVDDKYDEPLVKNLSSLPDQKDKANKKKAKVVEVTAKEDCLADGKFDETLVESLTATNDNRLDYKNDVKDSFMDEEGEIKYLADTTTFSSVSASEKPDDEQSQKTKVDGADKDTHVKENPEK